MNESTPLANAAATMIQELEETNRHMRPKPRTGPVTCGECGEIWTDCTCDETGITRNNIAFHDAIGGTYKVWSSEDTVHLDHEDKHGAQSIIFLPSELTCLAQSWLALQEPNGTTHEHVFASTLDPRYEACSSGVARQKQGYGEIAEDVTAAERVAANTRREIEAVTGQPVINARNKLKSPDGGIFGDLAAPSDKGEE